MAGAAGKRLVVVLLAHLLLVSARVRQRLSTQDGAGGGFEGAKAYKGIYRNYTYAEGASSCFASHLFGSPAYEHGSFAKFPGGGRILREMCRRSRSIVGNSADFVPLRRKLSCENNESLNVVVFGGSVSCGKSFNKVGRYHDAVCQNLSNSALCREEAWPAQLEYALNRRFSCSQNTTHRILNQQN